MAQLKCPNCGREFVRRVSRTGAVEVLLSWFYVYPFKCQLCGQRFRLFQWRVRYVRVKEDRRVYDRMEINFPLSFVGQDISGEGTVINLSMGGCRFRTNAHIETGAVLTLSLQISQEVPPVTVDGAVARDIHAGTVGVEFVQWQQSERDRLQHFVRGLLIGRGVELEPLVSRPEPLLPG